MTQCTGSKAEVGQAFRQGEISQGSSGIGAYEVWILNLPLYYRSGSGGIHEVSHPRQRKQEEPTLGSIEAKG